MKLVFVYWGFENAGSMLDLRGYTRAARAMGHDVTVYGPPGHARAELLAGPRRRRCGRLRLRMDDQRCSSATAWTGSGWCRRCPAGAAS